VQLLRWRWVFGVHVDDEVGIGGEEGHLSLGVPAIRAVGVGLGKLADGEAVGSFFGGDGDVLAHADF
jgi:hypothetical protein